MKPGNTVTRLGVNISSSLITAMIRITVLVWINQYLLRRILTEEYALLPVITSLMVIVELIPIIFNQGVHRFMVAADARDDKDRLVSVVSSMIPVLASLSALVLIGGGLASFWISALIRVDPIYVNDARLMLLLLVLGLALQIGSTPFPGRPKRQDALRRTEPDPAGDRKPAGDPAAGADLGIGPRILWVVVASSVGSTLNILILIFYTSRVLPEARFRAGAISLQTMWQLTSFSLWTLVQIFNRGVIRAAPALFLNHAGSAVDVASYHLGNLADMQLNKLQSQSMLPLMPSLTNLYARDGEAPIREPLLSRRALLSLGNALPTAADDGLRPSADQPLYRRALWRLGGGHDPTFCGLPVHLGVCDVLPRRLCRRKGTDLQLLHACDRSFAAGRHGIFCVLCAIWVRSGQRLV